MQKILVVTLCGFTCSISCFSIYLSYLAAQFGYYTIKPFVCNDFLCDGLCMANHPRFFSERGFKNTASIISGDFLCGDQYTPGDLFREDYWPCRNNNFKCCAIFLYGDNILYPDEKNFSWYCNRDLE